MSTFCILAERLKNPHIIPTTNNPSRTALKSAKPQKVPVRHKIRLSGHTGQTGQAGKAGFKVPDGLELQLMIKKIDSDEDKARKPGRPGTKQFTSHSQETGKATYNEHVASS